MLIHINLSHVRGVGYEEEEEEEEETAPPVIRPSPSPPPSEAEIAVLTNNISRGHTPVPSMSASAATAGNGGSDGGVIVESSRSRVGFVDSPEIVNIAVVEEHPPVEPSTSWGE